MKLLTKVGTTSKRIVIFVQDSSSSVGAGLAGLVFNTASLVWYYWREDAGNAGGTQVTLATATRGSWSTGGLKEIDATNLPGFYELGVPDAVLASGAAWAVMMLKGAANMAPVVIEIQLVSFDPTDSVRMGLTALPNAAAAANGGLVTGDSTNAVKIQSALRKNTARAGFAFPMFDSAGTPTTGLTITATRSIDGAAFASCANSATEIANGWYTIDLAAADLNGNVIALRFAAAAVRDTDIQILTQP